MPVWIARHAADAITVARIALTPIFLWTIVRGEAGEMGVLAAALFAVIALSDFVDGRVARHFGTDSSMGRVLDHVADIGFILAAFAVYVAVGAVPWWVPASIAAAFGTYVVDSWLRSGPRPSLIGSRIGHLGGVCNYALIGVLVGNDSLGLHWLPPSVVYGLCLLVPVYSAASIVTRLMPRGLIEQRPASG